MLRPEDIQGWEIIHLMHNETHVIMQSTGLTDRLGKEIFEGDVIRGYNGLIAAIEWGVQSCDDCQAAYGFGTKTNQMLESGSDPAIGFEIIGNIYENPDLLPSQL